MLGCSISLADLRVTQGRLGDARRTYEGGLRLRAEHGDGGPVLRGTADMYVGLGPVALDRGDLAAAAAAPRAAPTGSASSNGLRQNPYRCRVARGPAAAADGDPAAAVALLDEAERRLRR